MELDIAKILELSSFIKQLGGFVNAARKKNNYKDRAERVVTQRRAFSNYKERIKNKTGDLITFFQWFVDNEMLSKLSF